MNPVLIRINFTNKMAEKKSANLGKTFQLQNHKSS